MAGLLAVISALYPDHLSRNLYPLLLLLGILCGCGIATFSVGISQVSYRLPKAFISHELDNRISLSPRPADLDH
jgi:NNP family nitrate/nitrite transporter-like MFS transporter